MAQTPRVIVTQLAVHPDEAARLKQLAATHERTVACEVRYAVRDWLQRHDLAAAQPQGQPLPVVLADANAN